MLRSGDEGGTRAEVRDAAGLRTEHRMEHAPLVRLLGSGHLSAPPRAEKRDFYLLADADPQRKSVSAQRGCPEPREDPQHQGSNARFRRLPAQSKSYGKGVLGPNLSEGPLVGCAAKDDSGRNGRSLQRAEPFVFIVLGWRETSEGAVAGHLIVRLKE